MSQTNDEPVRHRKGGATMPERYDWISWLRERDAQMLLISLMNAIERGSTPEVLSAMVKGWRDNAHKALRTNNYRASVDKYLEVTVDARPYLFRTGELAPEEPAVRRSRRQPPKDEAHD